ncbi:hypothetical protein C0995_006024, partial [Termitomyces sp. Mi166
LKPLPALPQTSLSLPALQHRGRLIRIFLSEIAGTSIESKREAWVCVIEEVLDEMGRAMEQGWWLEGLRKAREEGRKGGLCLCVAPFDVVPSAIGCSFVAGTYGPTVLFGSNEGSMVGGTFVVRGLTSAQEHGPLCRVLRLSIYVHLSLTLEQHLLVDSGLTLRFPAPPVPIRSLPPAPAPTRLRTLFSAITSLPLTRERKRSSLATPVVHAPPAPAPAPAPALPFTRALATLRANAGLLSTSPGTAFEPPPLLIELAAHGRTTPSGAEHTALSSILGWDPSASLALTVEGMVGSAGFVRHQGIEVLESRCVRGGDGETRMRACERPRWRTLRYYAYWDEEGDAPLGMVIKRLVDDDASGRMCEEGCGYLKGEHETRIVHGGASVRIRVGADEGERETDKGKIDTWTSCTQCGAKSTRREISNGTFQPNLTLHQPSLLSYSKFIELLIYSPTLALARPCACKSRFGLQMHFSVSADVAKRKTPSVVSFVCTNAEDVFELRMQSFEVPSLSGRGKEEEERELWTEMGRWWDSVRAYLDRVEAFFASQKHNTKALPRLPSTETLHSSHYPARDHNPNANVDSRSAPESSGGTCVPVSPPPPHSSIPTPLPTPKSKNNDDDDDAVIPGPNPIRTTNPLASLTSLRHALHTTEHALYAYLAHTRVGRLNDVRRAFVCAARGAERRVRAWEGRYLGGGGVVQWRGWEKEVVPVWCAEGKHVFPGSSVVVDERDWGSVIAFTLSAEEYKREMGDRILQAQRIPSLIHTPNPPPIPTSSSPSSSSTPSNLSFFTTIKLFPAPTSTSTATSPDPDPDTDDPRWTDADELFSAVVSRKEHHPKDAAGLGLLGIREVLRQRRSFSPGAGAEKAQGAGLDERVCSVDALEAVDKSTTGGVSVVDEGSVKSEKEVVPPPPPPPPPKDEWHIRERGNTRKRDVSSAGTASSFASTLTSGLNGAVWYMLNGTLGGTPNTAGASSEPARSEFLLSPHDLPSGAAAIDDRPHITLDWTAGTRLRFSCTVYYAQQFAGLRRRWGVDDDAFVRSLRRCKGWEADGGKSRSDFWKTEDERFVIKTLVDAWNVADLQVLVDLAPSYFRYMDTSASGATVLAKMMGFYTIEIRNLETGNIQSKADLLVMENLFYRQTVTKTFDLKGIQGRKVKHSNGSKVAQKSSKTLYDAEWIEEQQKAIMLVRPHAQHVLRAAIRSDADFLAKSNIMDYSLLVGVDEEHKQIACGLVDTIGSYTFAKTLEYKAKHGLKPDKEITVIPPVEYQERFVSALEGYFLACPDKWSKPMDKSKLISDANLLPSVL